MPFITETRACAERSVSIATYQPTNQHVINFYNFLLCTMTLSPECLQEKSASMACKVVLLSGVMHQRISPVAKLFVWKACDRFWCVLSSIIEKLPCTVNCVLMFPHLHRAECAAFQINVMSVLLIKSRLCSAFLFLSFPSGHTSLQKCARWCYCGNGK